jgi:hypothetical protein
MLGALNFILPPPPPGALAPRHNVLPSICGHEPLCPGTAMGVYRSTPIHYPAYLSYPYPPPNLSLCGMRNAAHRYARSHRIT